MIGESVGRECSEPYDKKAGIRERESEMSLGEARMTEEHHSFWRNVIKIRFSG
jgi:hypothetical protein